MVGPNLEELKECFKNKKFLRKGNLEFKKSGEDKARIRTFVLINDILYHYKDLKKDTSIGIISLNDAKIYRIQGHCSF